MWYDENNVNYNRFTNLDSIEDRVIYYLISEQGKNEKQLELVHTLWRLLVYSDTKALIDDAKHPLPTYEAIRKLIDTDSADQQNKRIFRSPFLEDAFVDTCSMLRIYLDAVRPTNHLVSVVDVGVEVIIHNKIVNVINPLYDDEGNPYNPTEENPIVSYKNRATMMLKCILALLNGADVAGVGKFQFNLQMNRFDEALSGVWNNRNFYGFKTVLSCQMSGVA